MRSGVGAKNSRWAIRRGLRGDRRSVRRRSPASLVGVGRVSALLRRVRSALEHGPASGLHVDERSSKLALTEASRSAHCRAFVVRTSRCSSRWEVVAKSGRGRVGPRRLATRNSFVRSRGCSPSFEVLRSHSRERRFDRPESSVGGGLAFFGRVRGSFGRLRVVFDFRGLHTRRNPPVGAAPERLLQPTVLVDGGWPSRSLADCCVEETVSPGESAPAEAAESQAHRLGDLRLGLAR